MSFELTNAPTAFIDLINKVFWYALDQYIIVFINEILVFLKNCEEHADHLSCVLETLRRNHLYVKFISQKELNIRQRCWIYILKDYDYKILYYFGKGNVVADALSRKKFTLSTQMMASSSKLVDVIQALYLNHYGNGAYLTQFQSLPDFFMKTWEAQWKWCIPHPISSFA
ncbi:uncharacterized protein LOC110824800 [Carica papaya]|uniref:uncharacterized protein LOC110824800 n=1 Tax=Carica papaya TaxID=3649 RepID=UPI000B8CCE98|nr:uncharacterized protein LOC110824800 [Carica papaya]